jgi:hypothetical protein
MLDRIALITGNAGKAAEYAAMLGIAGDGQVPGGHRQVPDSLVADGKRVRYNVLGPGAAYTQPTYVGHYWLIATSSGQCLQIIGVNNQGHVMISQS